MSATDLKAEVLLLRKENAKLRGERDMYRYLVSCMVHPDITDQLSVENDRLRELAKGLYEFAYAEYPRAAKAGFADDLRELGIEVEE